MFCSVWKSFVLKTNEHFSKRMICFQIESLVFRAGLTHAWMRICKHQRLRAFGHLGRRGCTHVYKRTCEHVCTRTCVFAHMPAYGQVYMRACDFCSCFNLNQKLVSKHERFGLYLNMKRLQSKQKKAPV